MTNAALKINTDYFIIQRSGNYFAGTLTGKKQPIALQLADLVFLDLIKQKPSNNELVNSFVNDPIILKMLGTIPPNAVAGRLQQLMQSELIVPEGFTPTQSVKPIAPTLPNVLDFQEFNEDTSYQVHRNFALQFHSEGFIANFTSDNQSFVIPLTSLFTLLSVTQTELISETAQFRNPLISEDEHWGYMQWFIEHGLIVTKRKPEVSTSDAPISRSNEIVKGSWQDIEKENKVPVYFVPHTENHYPLALGLIYTALKQFDDGKLLDKIQLIPITYLEPDQFLQGPYKKFGAGVWLFSNYLWSEETNLAMSKFVKQDSPRNITIHGGPSTPDYPEKCEQFFVENNSVDIAVHAEGEVSIGEILDTLIVADDNFKIDIQALKEVNGISYRDYSQGVAHIVHTDKRTRMKDPNVIPSPYMAGVFDHYGDIVEAAIIESNRGCPFGCTFCDWGSAINQKVRKFDMDRVKEEIHWIAKNKTKVLWIADANFGIYDRDIEVAEYIIAMKQEFGYPQEVVVNYTKNTTVRLVDIIKVFSDGGIISQGVISIQKDWSIWANASVNKSNSFGRYAPVPDSSYFSTPLTGASPNNPTNPTGNTWDGTSTVGVPVNWWHRFDALGNRDGYVDNELSEVMTGMTGQVGDVEIDFGIRKTANKTYDIGYNYLLRSAAATYIESGEYDLRNPYATPQNILNAMSVTISRISRYDQDEAWFTAAFDAFEMDAGFAQMFVGAEYREEDYDDKYDSLSEAGQVGGSAGNSAGGTRDVTAFYFELLMPVLDNLEVTVAGRQDDYSDYGSDFSPKLSARWVVSDDMTLRVSYGEGFRAPTLDILTQLDSFSADSVRDEQSCINQGQPANCSLQINGLRTANPSLGSEQSEQYAFGLAHQPTDWFNYTVDYYSIEITDRINFFSAQELVNKEIAGDPIPAGLGVERTPNGSISRVVQGFGNEGSVETSGLDINLVFNYEALGGRFNHNVQIGHLIEQTVDSGRNLVKDPGLPENRMVIANTYELDNFSVGYNLNLIGNQCDDIVAQECVGNVPTWVTHDVQFNYFAPWDGRITVGVRNAGEKRPPIGLGAVGSRDYDFGLYDAYGRITYVQYTQTF